MTDFTVSRSSWSLSRRILTPILGLLLGFQVASVRAQSNPSNTPPAELTTALSKWDAAASREDLASVMQFYGTNFKQSDGYNRANFEKALTQFWQKASQLKYQTTVNSWRREGNNLIAETTTRITGQQMTGGREMKLESTIKSRQTFAGTQIVQQDILSEKTLLTAGAKPPTVELKLPEQVRIGQTYSFDAIVQEPLGDDLMLGSAMETPVQSLLNLKPQELELELLSAGGLFKTGKAPAKQGNHWISAMFIREEGMTIITQRLRVVDR